MYEMNERIRYSEADADAKLTLSALMNYFQDCCFFHSEDMGVGLDYLTQRNLAWVLSAWQICINDRPNAGEEVVVQTWPYEFKGFYGLRNYSMNTTAGERLAYANAIWVMIDITTGRPAKIPEEVSGAYQQELPIPMRCRERKIPIPKEYVEKEPIPVQKYFIDTNQHVNNEKYVMIAQEFVPDGFQIREIRVEYKKPAVLNDVLYPHVTETNERVTVVLADSEGLPYAIILFDASGQDLSEN